MRQSFSRKRTRTPNPPCGSVREPSTCSCNRHLKPGSTLSFRHSALGSARAPWRPDTVKRKPAPSSRSCVDKLQRAREIHRKEKERAMRVNAIPAGHRTVTPYLAIKNAVEALEFYKQAFGATERFRLLMPD